MVRILAVLLLQFTMALAAVADKKTKSPLDDVYNEDAINRVLAESDSTVGLLVRLKMMRAHLNACRLMISEGNMKEAAEHVSHPREEIYADLEPMLAPNQTIELRARLDAAEASLANGSGQQADEAVSGAISYVDSIEAEVQAHAGVSELQVEIAAMLLRTAVVEYHESFQYTKLTNLVEYHDGAFFVEEAKLIVAKLVADYGKRDKAAYAKLETAMKELSAAWPADAPPGNSVMAVTKMQALVSIIELQLNKLRKGS